jgi:hypothetical protein
LASGDGRGLVTLEGVSITAPRASSYAERFECAGGWATISLIDPVILLVMHGTLDGLVGKRIAAALNTLLVKADEPVRSFWDLGELVSYHSDVRVLCTQSLVRNWPKVANLQTLATNRVVKMGVAVANVALRGRLRNTESRAEFERLLREATTTSLPSLVPGLRR